MVLTMHKKKMLDSHDACVSAIAKELSKDNWEVKANLKGWKKPSRIGRRIPDLEAKKEGCLTRICEVATEEMFNGDKNMYTEFRNYCDEYDFHFYAIKNGKRIQINPNDIGKIK